MAVKSGRPRVTLRPGFNEGFAHILPRLVDGEISQRRAAEELNMSPRSLRRLLQARAGPDDACPPAPPQSVLEGN